MRSAPTMKLYILHPIITLSKMYFWFSCVSYSFLGVRGIDQVDSILRQHCYAFSKAWSSSSSRNTNISQPPVKHRKELQQQWQYHLQVHKHEFITNNELIYLQMKFMKLLTCTYYCTILCIWIDKCVKLVDYILTNRTTCTCILCLYLAQFSTAWSVHVCIRLIVDCIFLQAETKLT